MSKKRPTHLGIKLVILGLCAGLLLLWVAQGWPCLIRTVTGIPCIGCGMSRAWLSALRLDLSSAFAYHPMFWIVPILIVFAFYDGRLLRNQWLNGWVLGLLLSGLLASYLIRLVAYLRGDFAF